MNEKRFRKGDWTNCRYDICEIVTDDDEIICVVALNDADKIIGLLEENEQLKKRVDKLKVIIAEFGATLLMNGFDIEVDGKDLMEMVNNE